MQGFFHQYLSLYRPLINHLNEMLTRFGLSYSLWQVILYVEMNGPSQLASISDYFYIERPSVTRVVQRLEEKGLVEHVPGNDRREKTIRLTKRGKKVNQSCRREITKMENRILADIPQDTLQEIFDTLPAIRDSLLTARKENKHDKN